MKLTREQAITEHRKMWNWIADQYKEGSTETIEDLKDEYTKGSVILHSCFCCEYTATEIYGVYYPVCDNCPVLWGTESEEIGHFCEGEKSSYVMAHVVDITEREMQCRKIANLPERKTDEDQNNI